MADSTVICGYYDNDNFYEDSNHTTLIEPVYDSFYMNIPNGVLYKYTTSYSEVSGVIKGYYYQQGFYSTPEHTEESKLTPTTDFGYYIDKNKHTIYRWNYNSNSFIQNFASYNGYYRSSKFYKNASGGSAITHNPKYFYYVAKNTNKVYLWNYGSDDNKYVEFASPVYLATDPPDVKHGKRFDELLTRLYNFHPETWSWIVIDFSKINTVAKLNELENGNYVVTNINSASASVVKKIIPTTALGYTPSTVNLVKFDKLSNEKNYIIQNDNALDPIYNYADANILLILPEASYLGKVGTSSVSYKALQNTDEFVVSETPPDNPTSNTYWITPRRLSGSSTQQNPVYIEEYNLQNYLSNNWTSISISGKIDGSTISNNNYLDSRILDPLDKRIGIYLSITNQIQPYQEAFSTMRTHIIPDPTYHPKERSDIDTSKSEKEYWNSKISRQNAAIYLEDQYNNYIIPRIVDPRISEDIPSVKINALNRDILINNKQQEMDENHFKNTGIHYGLSVDGNGRMSGKNQNVEFRANERIYKIDYTGSGGDMWLNETYTNNPYQTTTVTTPTADQIKIPLAYDRSADPPTPINVIINETTTSTNYEVGRPFHSGNTWYDDEFQSNYKNENNTYITNTKFYKVNNPDNVNKIRLFNENDTDDFNAYAINTLEVLKTNDIISDYTTINDYPRLIFKGLGKPTKILAVVKTMNQSPNKVLVYASYPYTYTYEDDQHNVQSFDGEKGLLYFSNTENFKELNDITDYVPGGRQSFTAHHHISVVEDKFIMDYKDSYIYTTDGYTWHDANIIPFIGVTNFFNPENREALNPANIYSCSTAASTTNKDITAENFVLSDGCIIRIRFTKTNTKASPKLNVNSTGAKAIWINGAAITSENFSYLSPNADDGYTTFKYDAANNRYVIIENDTGYGTYFAVTEDHNLLGSRNNKEDWDVIHKFADNEICTSIRKVEDNTVISTSVYANDTITNNLYRLSENKLTLEEENILRINNAIPIWHTSHNGVLYSIIATKNSNKSYFKIYFSIDGLNYGNRTVKIYDKPNTSAINYLTNNTEGFIVYKEKIYNNTTHKYDYYLTIINRSIRVSSKKYYTNMYSIKLPTLFGENNDLVEMKLLTKDVDMSNIDLPSEVLDYHIEDGLNKYIYYEDPTVAVNNRVTNMSKLFNQSVRNHYSSLNEPWNWLFRKQTSASTEDDLCNILNAAFSVMREYYKVYLRPGSDVDWHDINPLIKNNN